MIDPTTQSRYERLQQIVREMLVLVAFSGGAGLDARLGGGLHDALGDRAVAAATGESDSLAEVEGAWTRRRWRRRSAIATSSCAPTN